MRAAQARTRFADALPDFDSWKAAVGKLEKAFAGEDRRAISEGCDALLIDTANHLGSQRIWRTQVSEVVKRFVDHGALNHLGDALVRHLSNLAASPTNTEGLRQWAAQWASSASEHEAMRLPMRLLRVGIDYRSSQPKDEGKLLQLPAEERLLLRQALGLPA